MGKRADRVRALDGLRALAITGVILTHAWPAQFPGGQTGVDVFFGLSGYLITGLLLAEYDRRASIRLKYFYARRALRLIPAYVVFLVGATLIAIHYGGIDWTGDLLPAGTYTTDFRYAFGTLGGSYMGHSWSLSIEEQFYLLWPLGLIFLLRRDRSRLALWIGCLALAFLLFTITLQVFGLGAARLYFLPTTRFSELLAGAAAAAFVREGLPARVVRTVGAVPLAVGVLCLMVAYTQRSTFYDPWSYRGGFTLVAVMTVILILHAEENPNSIVTRSLGCAPMALIGRRSYAAYLWQIPALIIADHHTHSAITRFGLTVVLTAIAASASWYLVERPFLRFKRRFEIVRISEPTPVAGGSEGFTIVPGPASVPELH
jgi:peptidoglycan/LPS O-acetylase OafA/YrhL